MAKQRRTFAAVICNEKQPFYYDVGWPTELEAKARGLAIVMALLDVPWKAQISARIEDDRGVVKGTIWVETMGVKKHVQEQRGG